MTTRAIVSYAMQGSTHRQLALLHCPHAMTVVLANCQIQLVKQIARAVHQASTRQQLVQVQKTSVWHVKKESTRSRMRRRFASLALHTRTHAMKVSCARTVPATLATRGQMEGIVQVALKAIIKVSSATVLVCCVPLDHTQMVSQRNQNVLVILSFMDLIPCHYFATAVLLAQFVWRTHRVPYATIHKLEKSSCSTALEGGQLSAIGAEILLQVHML